MISACGMANKLIIQTRPYREKKQMTEFCNAKNYLLWLSAAQGTVSKRNEFAAREYDAYKPGMSISDLRNAVNEVYKTDVWIDGDNFDWDYVFPPSLIEHNANLVQILHLFMD